ncbi:MULTISPECIES: hypothetical protein [Alistipes]|uniref:hypothetical protein n=1 Tax=Alistipes TaxID=239759 RepID=UPI0013EBE673|nr:MULTISPECIES: hypothetical protein [Alistipes]MBR2219327.1 hypothetical protein [Alistipes sp.]
MSGRKVASETLRPIPNPVSRAGVAPVATIVLSETAPILYFCVNGCYAKVIHQQKHEPEIKKT